MNYSRATWSIDFACCCVAIRSDIEFWVYYDEAIAYLDNLPNIIREKPWEIARYYIESLEDM